MKRKSIFKYILVSGVLVCLLLSAAGCKKKPVTDPTDTQTLGMSPTESLSNIEDNQPTENLAPTQSNLPTQSADPVESTGTTEAVTTEPACNHVPGKWIVDKTSTCTTEGSRHRVCTLCDETVEEETIPTLPHTPGNWTVDKKPTCSAEGRQHQVCSQCKKILIYITVAKAEHTPATVYGKAATTTATGLTDGSQCSGCKTVLQEQYTIPKAGSVTFSYQVNSDDTCTITGLGNATGSTIVLPSAISGHSVTAIGEKAFENCAGIAKIYLPNTVTKIGAGSFSGCTGLTEITFQGTLTQWSNVSKSSGWNANTGNYSVRCQNGILQK